jgi:addiction module HigA family antidote
VIKSFADSSTEALFRTGRSKRVPADVARRALRRFEAIDAATVLTDLRVPPGSRLHALKGDRAGQHAICVNDQWRICFRFKDGDAHDVEFCDYHELERLAMSIPNTRPRERRPIHPGEILREDFLPEYGLSVTALAAAAGVSRQSINELLRERRAVTPEMALRLGKLFGNSPEFWLNLQRSVDLWDAARGLKQEIAHIQPLQVA